MLLQNQDDKHFQADFEFWNAIRALYRIYKGPRLALASSNAPSAKIFSFADNKLRYGRKQ